MLATHQWGDGRSSMSSNSDLNVYQAWLGIPPEECDAAGPHHYQLLGLRVFEKDTEAIDAAVRQTMAKLSDHAAGPHRSLAQRLMVEVESAMACLCDPAEKARYDRALALGERPASRPRQQSGCAAPAVMETGSADESPVAALDNVQVLVQPVPETEYVNHGYALQPIDEPEIPAECVSTGAPSRPMRRRGDLAMSLPAMMAVLGGLVGLVGGYFIMYYLLGEDLLRMLPPRDAILRVGR